MASDRCRSDRLILVLLAVAVVYRIFLTTSYYGWEESDYGNLAMARGVLESGFRDYDMRHLPLYYFLSALVLGIVGNTIIATHAVALIAGTLAVYLAHEVARKAFDVKVARLTALLLIFQPEFALYSASSLRDPLFTALVLAGCLCLLRGNPKSSAVFTGFSFLTRFDSLATNMVAVSLHLLRRPPRVRNIKHPLWTVLAIFCLFIGGWSVYCGLKYDTFLFFLPTVEVNIDTGGAQEISERLEFIVHGLRIVFSLFFSTLPGHIGFFTWILAFLGAAVHRRELFGRTAKGTVFSYLVINTAFWLFVGFVGQHEPEHNLYWIWMYTLISFWMMFAAAGIAYFLKRIAARPPFTSLAGFMIVLLVGVPFFNSTRAQLERSAVLYKPQVDLARWVESNVPEGTTLIFDNIPSCYIDRKAHGWKFISWFDVVSEPGNENAFESFLLEKRVKYVLWFKEEWTQAPKVAPFLEPNAVHAIGALTLTPLFSEDNYGFIFYEVSPAEGGQQ